MSLELNRSDFNNAISDMESTVDDLNGVVANHHVNILVNVLHEYEHLDSSIEDTQNELDSLRKEVEDLQDEVFNLQEIIDNHEYGD